MDAGGFAPAARRLGVSASTVSKTVARLEARLGVQLFVRAARSVKPTEAGRLFHARCGPILDALEEARDELAQLQGRASGTLRVAVEDGVGRQVLVSELLGFLKANPGLRVEVVSADEPVISGDVDVTVRASRPLQEGFVARRLATNHRVVTAAPAYLARCGTPRTPYDLKDHDCLGLVDDPSAGRWAFEVAGRRVELALDGHVAASSLEGLVDAAVAGLGIIRTPALTVHNALREQRLVRLLDEHELPHGGGVYAVFAETRKPPRKVRAFVDFLARVFNE